MAGVTLEEVGRAARGGGSAADRGTPRWNIVDSPSSADPDPKVLSESDILFHRWW